MGYEFNYLEKELLIYPSFLVYYLMSVFGFIMPLSSGTTLIQIYNISP